MQELGPWFRGLQEVSGNEPSGVFNILGYVHKYSPAVVKDPKLYEMECYNRFMHGLELDWREAIDAGIPFGKETIERAYHQAIKYELRRKESKQVAFTGAAMTDRERDNMQRLKLEMDEIKTELHSIKRSSHRDRDDQSGYKSLSPHSKKNFQSGKSHKNIHLSRQSGHSEKAGDCSSTSGKSDSSCSLSEEDFKAFQSADEVSDSKAIRNTLKGHSERHERSVSNPERAQATNQPTRQNLETRVHD